MQTSVRRRSVAWPYRAAAWFQIKGVAQQAGRVLGLFAARWERGDYCRVSAKLSCCTSSLGTFRGPCCWSLIRLVLPAKFFEKNALPCVCLCARVLLFALAAWDSSGKSLFQPFLARFGHTRDTLWVLSSLIAVEIMSSVACVL